MDMHCITQTLLRLGHGQESNLMKFTPRCAIALERPITGLSTSQPATGDDLNWVQDNAITTGLSDPVDGKHSLQAFDGPILKTIQKY
jgi:hypothetical protein